ncbi:hypothetical protein JCM8547_005662 [Rhodosporidiobolus lusitaniae]
MPSVAAINDSPIPLIDLCVSPFPTAQELAPAVLDAVSRVGFLFLRLPEEGAWGLGRREVREVFELHRRLFSSPLEERLACLRTNGARNGYLRFGENRLAESKGAGDLKENFNYGTANPDGVRELASQRLPKSVDNEKDRATLEGFHKATYELMNILLDAFSVALELPQDYFRSRHEQGQNTMGLINYPPVPVSSASNAADARASAHKDWGSVTLLFQEESGTPGLEVFLPHSSLSSPTSSPSASSATPYALITETDTSPTIGSWHSAPVIPGTVLVNLGLALESWTDGVMKATLHRVVLPQELAEERGEGGEEMLKGRKSIAVFCNARPEVRLTPVGKGGVAKEVKGKEAMTMKEFVEDRIRTTVGAAAA